VADFEVHLNDAAVYDLLNGADGPVAAMLDELSERAAAVARAAVPVRKLDNDRRRHSLLARGGASTSFPPGYTLVSIHANVHWYNGLIYGGVAAAEEPTIFLEYPAEQMKRKYPFLSLAFDTMELD
jgi:hypothetical protein